MFSDLLYSHRQSLFVRHYLDAMSIIGTLLNIPSKTKDNVKFKLDLIEMKLRKQLTPEKRGQNTHLPPACQTLPRNEKIKYVSVLLELRCQVVLIQYSKSRVKERYKASWIDIS